ncbi:MAG: 30S ribosomal protein S8 [Acidobacteria bacterium]|nr:MAG: 30S ribosomal protein S8 [Acidobacteriota bacterium]
MSMTDPIADMLTRIRNAVRARHPRVEMPHSKVKEHLAGILKREGYLDAVAVVRPKEGGFPVLRIALRYTPEGAPLISGLERVSKPGRRVYCSKSDIPKVLGGLGVSVVSTSRGLMSGEECAKAGVGGEVLCNIW